MNTAIERYLKKKNQTRKYKTVPNSLVTAGYWSDGNGGPAVMYVMVMGVASDVVVVSGFNRENGNV